MLGKEDNDLLCRVGPGTPMGELMRQYWIPALYGWELEPDGQPLRIRLLGEDLIALRDTTGKVGVTQENCPHRGVACSSAATKKRACAASTTAGSSTPRATASTCRTSRPRACSRARSRATAYQRPRPAATSGSTWAQGDRAAAARLRVLPVLPEQPGPSHATSWSTSATGCRRSRASSTPRTSTSCTGASRPELPGKYGLWVDDKAARFDVVNTGLRRDVRRRAHRGRGHTTGARPSSSSRSTACSRAVRERDGADVDLRADRRRAHAAHGRVLAPQPRDHAEHAGEPARRAAARREGRARRRRADEGAPGRASSSPTGGPSSTKRTTSTWTSRPRRRRASPASPACACRTRP